MPGTIIRVTLAALAIFAGTVSGASIRGSVTVQRKLTPRNVTASAGLYQRGSAVPLESDAKENPLDYERSHVVVYLEGVPATGRSAPVTAQMEQQNRRFSPDLVVIAAGSSVSFP